MADKIRIEQNDYDDADEYQPTDSEDEYSEEDLELLKEVRERRRRVSDDEEKEFMAFEESDNEDDNMCDLIRDSDIEGNESDNELPSASNWGSEKRNYYNTDFVDPDYSTYTVEQEELAKEEEDEAKKIQIRLAKQMREEDFLLDDAIVQTVKPDRENEYKYVAGETIKINADLTGISKQDKLRLLQEDSPELLPLIRDFESYFKEIKDLIAPVMRYVRINDVPMIPALQFAQLYQNISLTYCSNVAFYLLIKAKRTAVRNHPVTSRLLQLKKLIEQLKDKYDNIIRPQLEALLERIIDGDKFEVLEIKDVQDKKPSNKKKKLGILGQCDEQVTTSRDIVKSQFTKDESEDGEMDGISDLGAENNARRGITYQIAKNKGLMPARKKELRNPRVKHRKKYRKALVRRKGAVRTVRKEMGRYDGEISGIKAGVSKSIKFKV